jgi:predicted ATPase
LVGPNASGKTTFLDVPAFLGELVSQGLDKTIESRSTNIQDLFFNHLGDKFELAIEAKIPDKLRLKLSNKELNIIRYEVAIGLDHNTKEIAILAESVLLKKQIQNQIVQRKLFPISLDPPNTILSKRGVKNLKTVVNKILGGNDNFYDETGKGWDHAFKLGPRKSALANLPDDESKFPVSSWFKKMLQTGIQRFILNSQVIRKASPPIQIHGFKPDGSNLPWVVSDLIKKYPIRIKDWVKHLKTALPDLEDIRTIERADDKHQYLTLCYKGGLEIPSWMASDGTLRLLALTLPAYLIDFGGIYLIEEPENGIHPRAVETMFQSLQSVYDAQILMATHSTVILNMVDLDKLLCFAKTKEGASDIVLGKEHPALKDWRGQPNLSILFGAGVLG